MIRDAVCVAGCGLVIGGVYFIYSPLSPILAGGLLVWASWTWRSDKV